MFNRLIPGLFIYLFILCIISNIILPLFVPTTLSYNPYPAIAVPRPDMFSPVPDTVLFNSSCSRIQDENFPTRLKYLRISTFKSSNFFAKYTYGNRRSNGIKLCQWNAGAGYLSNKQPELKNIIGGYKPHVVGVSESYFKKGQDLQDVQIQ